MTDLEKQADEICDRISWVRLETQGGYPDVWKFHDVDGVRCIIVASVDNPKEPTLLIQPVADFIAEWKDWPNE